MASDSKVGTTLKQFIDAGVVSRKQFLDTGLEIEKYAYSHDYDFLYQEWNQNGDGDLFFKAKVAKAAQFVEVVGPYLYQYNPTFNVESKAFAPPDSMKRHHWEEEYLKWAAGVGDQYTHCRRAVNQAATFGRGVCWTGYNPRKKCVQHEMDVVENLIIDPDARTLEEANIKIRRRLKPRWELMNIYPKAKGIIATLKKASELPSGMKDRSQASNPAELIRYYEIYMRVGLGRYGDGLTGDSGAVDDAPKKYILSEDGQVLDVLEWEIPFFIDDMWPCEELDLRELPGQVWPAAPMSPGMGHLRALNWIYTLYISKMRTTTRTPLVLFNYNGNTIAKDQVFKILRGDQMDIAMVTVNGNEQMKLGDMLQQFKFETGVDEFERFVGIIGTEFEKSTGLYDILFAGETQKQLRSAEDAKLKDRNSRTRIDDMKTQVEKWTTRLGKKMRFAARYFETSQDIAALFGPEAGMAWGDLAAPGVAQQQRQMQSQVASQITQQFLQQGAPPDQAAQQASQRAMEVVPITAVDFEDWLREADVSIESGSMRRLDRDQQIDAIDTAMNTVVPMLMQTGFTKSGLEIAKASAVINDMPEAVVKALDEAIALAQAGPPMMPMGGAGAPGAPGGAPPQDDKAKGPPGADKNPIPFPQKKGA